MDTGMLDMHCSKELVYTRRSILMDVNPLTSGNRDFLQSFQGQYQSV